VNGRIEKQPETEDDFKVAPRVPIRFPANVKTQRK
jgi:hypothetical protein